LTIKPWKLISSKKDRSFRIFDLRTDRAISPRTNKEHEFYVLESCDWVNVIPLTRQEDIVLIRQYRHGIRRVTLEIPGGLVEQGDSPEETARKELLEETGYSASEMILMGSVHANPAFLNNRCYTYLARNVTPSGGHEPEEKEDIEVVIKPFKEIPRLIREGEITHSLILAAFYRFYMEYQPSKP